MAIERSAKNESQALARTRPPTPNEMMRVVTTANQCAIEVDKLWKVMKELQAEVKTLKDMLESTNTTKPAAKKSKAAKSKSSTAQKGKEKTDE